MKWFLVRLSYYLIAFGFVLLIGFPIVLPLVSRIFVRVYVGHWEGWSETFDTAIWIVSKSLIVTPLASFVFTFLEYGQLRGWWK